jgi:hypothetical protein
MGRTEDDGDLPEDQRSFGEGFLDGLVEAVLSPLNWLGNLIGGSGDSDRPSKG